MIEFFMFICLWKSGSTFFLIFLSRSSQQQIMAIFSLPSNLFIAYFFSWPNLLGTRLTVTVIKRLRKEKKKKEEKAEEKKEGYRTCSAPDTNLSTLLKLTSLVFQTWRWRYRSDFQFKGEENEMQRIREFAPGLVLASPFSGDRRHCYFASNVEEPLDFLN